MGKIRFMLVLFFITSICGALLHNGKERQRRLAMALDAYETGCYDSAKVSCQHLYTEKDIYNCYEGALKYCPDNAKKFRDWIANVKKN